MKRPGGCYIRVGASANTYRPTALTTGPWSTTLSHGGPPSALLCTHVDKLASQHGFGHQSRVTINLLRPITVNEGDEINVSTSIGYTGKSVLHMGGTLTQRGKEVVSCTALAVKERPVELPVHDVSIPQAPPLNEAVPTPFSFGHRIGYDSMVECRVSQGTLFKGPLSCVWFRLTDDLVEGEGQLTPTAKAAMVADSGSGISMLLDPRRFSFVNADLSLDLWRPSKGEWICLKSTTHLWSETGTGLADSLLYDQDGLFGRASQNLVVSKR